MEPISLTPPTPDRPQVFLRGPSRGEKQNSLLIRGPTGPANVGPIGTATQESGGVLDENLTREAEGQDGDLAYPPAKATEWDHVDD